MESKVWMASHIRSVEGLCEIPLLAQLVSISDILRNIVGLFLLNEFVVGDEPITLTFRLRQTVWYQVDTIDCMLAEVRCSGKACHEHQPGTRN